MNECDECAAVYIELEHGLMHAWCESCSFVGMVGYACYHTHAHVARSCMHALVCILLVLCTRTHIHMLSPPHSHMHMLPPPHSHIHMLPLHTLTYTCSPSTLSHTHAPPSTLSHTHTPPSTLSHAHTHTYTHTQSQVIAVVVSSIYKTVAASITYCSEDLYHLFYQLHLF